MNMGSRDVLFDQLKAIPSLIDKDTEEVNLQLLLTRAQTNDSELLHTLYQNEELRKVFLPILRADVELLETYAEAVSEPLDFPITALGGTSDPAISKAMLAGWRTCTSAVFTQHEFPGEHFYINSEREAVIATILDDLARNV